MSNPNRGDAGLSTPDAIGGGRRLMPIYNLARSSRPENHNYPGKAAARRWHRNHRKSCYLFDGTPVVVTQSARIAIVHQPPQLQSP
jgi:hypothetical protein